MYESTLDLDARKNAREYHDIRAMHGLIMRAFPDGVGRVLWRNEGPVRVRSADQPDWAFLAGRGNLRVDRVPPAITPGRRAFQLSYSPTHKVDGRRRCVPMDARAEHLAQLLARHGARLIEVTTPYGTDRRGSGGERIVCVDATGTLDVTDVEAFTAAYALGIGPHRAYGCGLITLH